VCVVKILVADLEELFPSYRRADGTVLTGAPRR